jgi:hypothetical protein
MPRHKGSKDLKPCAQQRAARPRGIPLTEGIAHQPRREFIVSSSVRLACEKYLANPQPRHSPHGPIISPDAARDRPVIVSDARVTTVRDLEELFGRKLYAWEFDLWTIAGWTGSRRFLSIP